MNNDNDPIAMEAQSEPSKNAQSLQTLASGPLSSSLSSLASSSRTLPSNQGFHFFNNFDDFRLPIDRIAKTSDSLLQFIGSSSKTWDPNNAIHFPNNIDRITDDETYRWLVDMNDDILEQFDVSVDEFQVKEEKTGRFFGSDLDNNGFQLVQGKKKKKGDSGLISDSVCESLSGKEGGSSNSCSGAKVKKGALTMVTTGKAKFPFHVPTIRKPQEEYNILVDNSNQPFEHVWLQRSEDGLRFVHPLVDLEHNQYRSFQGLTCLMQISTRTEDFIVDTLKLRIHIGPYLREVFKDPMKKKVMHGSDKDILWLQRDFGIYLCNLFDTGQASKVLKLERNSLKHLLQHYCGVTANKEYQNADWRVRPLPDEMLRYAREDTHYLLYIYDLMRIKLLSMPKEAIHFDAPLVEALCEWRDIIARAEDESTGYVLPNKVLLEIAKQMPVTASKLRRLLKSKHPYVERNIGTVVSIIRQSMQNSVVFEAAAQQLRMGHLLNASGEHVAVNEGAEALPPETPTDSKIAIDTTEIIDGGMWGPDKRTAHPASTQHRAELLKIGSSISGPDMVKNQTRLSFEPDIMLMSARERESITISGLSGEANAWPVISLSAKIATGATVPVLKKPSHGFGSLLGNAATKKKSDVDKMKEEGKLEQIRSSVDLSFHSFSGTKEQPEPATKDTTRSLEVSRPEEPPTIETTESTLENIILLEDNLNKKETNNGNSSPEDETMSLSELSTIFQQCLQSINDQNRNVVKVEKPKEAIDVPQMKAFDYEAAMKEVKFGEEIVGEESGNQSNSAGKKKSSAIDRLQIDDGTKQFPQARRRAAFPASGNRNATFR